MRNVPTRPRTLAYVLEARRARVDALMSRLKVRETLAYDLCGYWALRYDFAYRDPANGRWRQFGTEGFWADPPTPEQLVDARDFSKRIIMREIDRQCGGAVEPLPMTLPECVTTARMV